MVPCHMSGISHHMDLHPGSNIYLTSWFIMSVLFLTFSETSVVPDQLVYSLCVDFDRS